MSKIQLYVKNPDAIHRIICDNVGDGDDEKADERRDQFADKYFEYGDYMMVEVDTKTMRGEIIERKRWKQ